MQPDLSGSYRHAGVTHRPVLHHMADKYLADTYAPETVAAQIGIDADRIRAIAADIARVAFDEAFELDIEWTDFRGDTHKTMVGRPVSFHSMRGISRPFQRLPDLPRPAPPADHPRHGRSPRRLPLQTALPETVDHPPETPRRRHPRQTPRRPAPWLPRTAPDDLLIDEDGNPKRIDKAFSWENPMSAHGLMHMVISNAYAGDPYKIDT